MMSDGMRMLAICAFAGIVLLTERATAFRASIHRLQHRTSSRLTMSSTSGDIRFVKYQGLGNDFILVDNSMSSNPLFTPEEAVKLCDRNFGIGGDGLIFAMPGENDCDYTMRIYNSDGSEPQMCGNGIRCMAKFLIDEVEKRSEADKDVTYTIWTKAGKIVPVVKPSGQITVDMGEPILNPEKVPTLLQANNPAGAAVEATLDVDGREYKGTAISMGNPHVVC